MAEVLLQTLDRITKEIDSIAWRKVELELMRSLQELDRHRQHFIFGIGEVVL